MLSSKGIPTQVTQLEQRAIDEQVLNVLTSGSGHKSHIIAAEDLFVGDLAWQNSLASELGQIAIRQ